ncbi:MAG TPA: apolipoprotein N-acyltransferase [Ignavibacteriales bacterium]|nr:apolipoprotein N-acyltransferase [Ignavibacteriales bacterium]HOL82189.1 apolipoprotein N-acyltransferase [Ignavibacteriales bacterium]HOM66313.1 apolipoprotein N-acyltransferase [Ignavibacteriales bacterium]HPD67990.1 apolipoprotein N-acyltransferase [Ignavibacteriales bacterium]HPP34432.1 apolipoprotein N-acyltransferase [Ignavibacteriales bacterium]
MKKIISLLENYWFAAIFTGVLFLLAFPPFNLYLLSFIYLVPYLYKLLQIKEYYKKFYFTYLTFFIVSLFLLYWVGSWQEKVDPFLMIGGVALIFFNPLTFMIPVTLFHHTEKKYGARIALFSLPFYWVFYEYIYSITDLRFPWLSLCNSLPYFTSFIQISNIITSYGLTLLVVYSNVLVLLMILNYKEKQKINTKTLLIYSISFILINIYGFIQISISKENGNRLKLKIVQPNLNPWEKWDDNNITNLCKSYLNLSKFNNQEKPDLIIWPETALPVYFLSMGYEKEVQMVRNFVDTNSVFLLSGMPHYKIFSEDENLPKYYKTSPVGYKYATYNSVIEFIPGEYKIPYYGKQRLVPFGEKVPFVEYIPILGEWISWNVGISSWNEGETLNLFKVKQDSIAAVVCYESIFPDLIAKLISKGAGALVVVTNDSWYGNSSGPYQHQAIAILRAVENHKPVIRCANGGISSYISPIGLEVCKTKMYKQEVLNCEILTDYHITFATNYYYIVPLISIFISLLSIVSYFITNKKV